MIDTVPDLRRTYYRTVYQSCQSRRSVVKCRCGAYTMLKETILIVDDHREIVAALSDVLKSKGYVVLAAYDGAKGFELAMAQSPDLILLDWNLPELSGMQ